MKRGAPWCLTRRGLHQNLTNAGRKRKENATRGLANRGWPPVPPFETHWAVKSALGGLCLYRGGGTSPDERLTGEYQCWTGKVAELDRPNLDLGIMMMGSGSGMSIPIPGFTLIKGKCHTSKRKRNYNTFRGMGDAPRQKRSTKKEALKRT